MLRGHCAHQKAAITSTLERQLFRTRILLSDQVLACSGKIIEHVLLFRKIAALVPIFSELATPSNIRNYIDATAIEPEPSRKIKIRRYANSVTAIAVKQRRVLFIAFS